jgi:hypothetical protein
MALWQCMSPRPHLQHEKNGHTFGWLTLRSVRPARCPHSEGTLFLALGLPFRHSGLGIAIAL